MSFGIEVRFTGRLAKQPRRSTSRTGTAWIRLTCDVPIYDSDVGQPAVTWVRIGVPGEAGEQYMHLEIGDEIAVIGKLRLNSYMKDDRPLIGLSVTPTSIRVRGSQETAAPATSRAGARVMAEFGSPSGLMQLSADEQEHCPPQQNDWWRAGPCRR